MIGLSVLGKIILGALAQGTALAATVVAVVHSDLSAFAQALIIAVVGATISAIGAIAAALLIRADTQHAEEIARENTRHLEDLKKAQGLNRREGDPPYADRTP